jgi:hypothetical protein
MDVNMIRGLAEQHKALKAVHTVCNRNGVALTVATIAYPETTATLDINSTALIIRDIRLALLNQIKETEESIQRLAYE